MLTFEHTKDLKSSAAVTDEIHIEITRGGVPATSLVTDTPTASKEIISAKPLKTRAPKSAANAYSWRRRRSGGPQTPQGCHACSKNALAHGAYAKLMATQSVLEGGQDSKYQQLYEELSLIYRPHGQLERNVLMTIALTLLKSEQLAEHWQRAMDLCVRVGGNASEFAQFLEVACGITVPSEALTALARMDDETLSQEAGEILDLVDALSALMKNWNKHGKVFDAMSLMDEHKQLYDGLWHYWQSHHAKDKEAGLLDQVNFEYQLNKTLTFTDSSHLIESEAISYAKGLRWVAERAQDLRALRTRFLHEKMIDMLSDVRLHKAQNHLSRTLDQQFTLLEKLQTQRKALERLELKEDETQTTQPNQTNSHLEVGRGHP